MGLDTSHHAFHGPYSEFGRWRKALASVINLDLDAMQGFGGQVPWASVPLDPLHILLNHSDCDGDISPEECAALAERLGDLLPVIPDQWRDITVRFIDGCHWANMLGEPLDFH